MEEVLSQPPDGRRFSHAPPRSLSSHTSFDSSAPYAAPRKNSYSQTPWSHSTPASSVSLEILLDDLSSDDSSSDDSGLAFPAYASGSRYKGKARADDEPPGHSPDPLPISEDDTAVRKEPSRHVDYLSHDWEEEDIWSTWRHIVEHRSIYGERSRLENASWRTWAKTQFKLKTVSPESLNWLKDCDVTWLYGPLQPASNRMMSQNASESVSRLSRTDSLNKRPILKKRSMHEVMLQKSLSSSSLVKQAAAAVQAQQASSTILERKRQRPIIGRATSDFVSFLIPSRTTSRDPTDYFSSRSTSGLQTPSDQNERRHIRFDDKVEQCIAVECKDADDDDDKDSSDESVVMMKRTRPPILHSQKALEGTPEAFRRLTWSSFAASAFASVHGYLLNLLRPRLKDGLERVTWTCGCGKAMYADVKELYDGGADHLQGELRRSAASAAQSSSRSPGNACPSLVPSGTVRPGDLTGVEPGFGSINPSRSSSDNINSPVAAGSEQTPSAHERFLLLCVNACGTAKLEQLALLPINNDQILFQDMRRAYIRMRTTYVRNFHPDTPKIIPTFIRFLDMLLSECEKFVIKFFKFLRLNWLVWWIGDSIFYIPRTANFVRFEIVPIKMDKIPQILEPSLPPKPEVDNKKYHYYPCPADVHPNALRIPYLHVFFEPGPHHDNFWTNRIPKKLNCRLEYSSGNPPAVGWGVHIVEGPNWSAFCIVLFLTLILALAYSIGYHDVSGGFTMAAYFVSALAVILALAVSQRS